MNKENDDSFVTCLQQCAGGPWTVFEARKQSDLDALVLRPIDESPEAPTRFVDFLENTFHRRLLHCFVGGNVNRTWTLEALLKQTRPPSQQALIAALDQCRSWQIVLAQEAMSTWQGHPRLEKLNNLGWTFEWVIQALLEREYHAQVRRHVILGEIAERGEIDVLAFLNDGRSFLIECKSSSKRLTDRQLEQFIAKGRAFPADRALLLIDTDDPHQMQQRMGQFGRVMEQAFGDASVRAIQRQKGSSIVCLRDHLYVADTGGGITATLQAVLAP